jgi:hypothetical protein
MKSYDFDRIIQRVDNEMPEVDTGKLIGVLEETFKYKDYISWSVEDLISKACQKWDDNKDEAFMLDNDGKSMPLDEREIWSILCNPETIPDTILFYYITDINMARVVTVDVLQWMLSSMLKNHDSEYGISWDTLSCYLDDIKDYCPEIYPLVYDGIDEFVM